MARPSTTGAALTVDLIDATMAAPRWPIYTPDDSADIWESTAGTPANNEVNGGFPGRPRAFMSSDGGDIAIEDVDGVQITVTTTAYTPVTEFAPTRILATGTTAAAVHLLY